jgi:hypothetical protein
VESFAASFASYVLFFGFVELPNGLFGRRRATHKALWVYLARRVRPSPTTSRRHTKFELALNLGAAKALGLIIPTTVLAIADELID